MCLQHDARIHHARNELFTRVCAAHGVRVEFIPPYSPWFNLIEELFSACKARVRREYRALRYAADPVSELMRIFREVGNPANAWGWVRDSGYHLFCA